MISENRLITCMMILSTFLGCHNFVIEEKLVGNYYLVASDEEYGCNLAFKENKDQDFGTLISPTVFAVGYNDDYMIVKQHPRTFPNPPDKSITNYYILPLKEGMNWRTKNGLIGPLTELEFIAKRKELEIRDDLTFTKVLKDLG